MNRRQWSIVGAAAVLLALGWFVFVIRDRDLTGFYRGYYTVGGATQAFRACGEDELWWVTEVRHDQLPTILQAQRAAQTTPSDETAMIYVEWYGTRSAKRQAATTKSAGGDGYGIMYVRHFTVNQILTARPPASYDCP